MTTPRDSGKTMLAEDPQVAHAVHLGRLDELGGELVEVALEEVHGERKAQAEEDQQRPEEVVYQVQVPVLQEQGQRDEHRGNVDARVHEGGQSPAEVELHEGNGIAGDPAQEDGEGAGGGAQDEAVAHPVSQPAVERVAEIAQPEPGRLYQQAARQVVSRSERRHDEDDDHGDDGEAVEDERHLDQDRAHRGCSHLSHWPSSRPSAPAPDVRKT